MSSCKATNANAMDLLEPIGVWLGVIWALLTVCEAFR